MYNLAEMSYGGYETIFVFYLKLAAQISCISCVDKASHADASAVIHYEHACASQCYSVPSLDCCH